MSYFDKRFTVFSAENGKIVGSEAMGVQDTIRELIRLGASQVHQASSWLVDANRSDYFIVDGILIVCRNGRRGLSRGKISTVFAMTKGIGSR